MKQTGQDQNSRAALGSLRLFLPFIRPYRWQIGLAALFLVSVSVALLSLGRGLAFIVDEGLTAENPALLDRAVLMMVCLALFLGIGSYFRMAIVNEVSEKIMADIRRQIFSHITKLPVIWFETARTGDILSRLSSDTAIVQTVLASTLVQAVRNVILLTGGLVLVVLSSAKMSLVVLVVVPVVVTPLILMARRLRRASREAQDRLGDVSATAEEHITNITTVFAFAQENRARATFSARVDEALATGLLRVRLRASLSGFVIAMVIMAVTVILWIGGRDLLAGQISAGDLSAFIFYAFLVATSTGTLSELGGELQRAAGAAERIAQLLDVPPEPDDPTAPRMPDASEGVSLVMQDVSFTYPARPERPVLEKVSLTAYPKQKIAIVGPSGAGKSTLFQILLGFYHPSSGQISLNDVDISQIKRSERRKLIGIVPQDPVLFSTSIRDNIAFGCPEATDSQIEQAACQAAADEFITPLADGYDTLVGERGVRLSGGQKQRIALARALLYDPQILLLDEATSALDSTHEAAITEALDAVMQNRTSLVIAHRLSTIIDADQIIVLDRGQVNAVGSHDELLETSELYRDLASRQFDV